MLEKLTAMLATVRALLNTFKGNSAEQAKLKLRLEEQTVQLEAQVAKLATVEQQLSELEEEKTAALELINSINTELKKF